jgi:lantibiotic biosynthesis protein
VVCQGERRLPLDLDDRQHRMLLRARLPRTGRVELREAAGNGHPVWPGRACELLIPLTLAQPTAAAAVPGTAARRPIVARGDLQLPGRAPVLHAHLHAHPRRFDEILTSHLPQLLAQTGGNTVAWWFQRHDSSQTGTDPYLGLYLRLPRTEDFGTVAAVVSDWADTLTRSGLLAQLAFGTYQPHTGTYGPNATAAEEVFAADSTAAIAEIQLSIATGVPIAAIAAASLADVAACFAPTTAEGWRGPIDLLPHERGPLDGSLRDATLSLAGATDRTAALGAYPGGADVVVAWEHRRAALAAYRAGMPDDHDPAVVLRALFHDHYVRVLGVDPDVERVVNRLARTVALRQIALTRSSTP